MTDNAVNQLDAEFAFLVIKRRDGRYAIGNLEDAQTEKEPSLDDIYAALRIVLRDLEANQIIAALANIQGAMPPADLSAATEVPEPNKKFTKVKRIK